MTDYAIKTYSKMIGISRAEQMLIIDGIKIDLRKTRWWQLKKRKQLKAKLSSAETIHKFPEKIKEAKQMLEDELSRGLFS